MTPNPTNSGDAAARFRIRPDLGWIFYPDSHRWVAQDPIANAFFYFNEIERDAARLLDGSRTAQEIVQTINRCSLQRPINPAWLEMFVQRLWQCNLVLSPVASASRGINKSRLRWGWMGRTLMNPLAIRIPLLRPSRNLPFARPLAALIFHPVLAVMGLLLLAITGFMLVLDWLHRPELLFYDIGRIQGDRWLALLAMLLVIKSLHEFGHYLASVHWRADCHEIGLLLLCFSPCLYCDTTNAWKLASKWHRAAISAAGIYMELWIAVLGGLIYLNTESGLWHILGAGAFLTCTIGTLLINGNPCFRYDGYYILSDLWGVPNLGAQSNAARWDTWVSWLGGRRPEPSRYDRPRWQLNLFAIISGLYRTMVLGLLAVFVWSLLVPAGLGILALMVLGVVALGLVAVLMRSIRATFSEFFGSKPIRAWRLAAALLAMTLLLWWSASVPISIGVSSRGFVELTDRQPIYATETAMLVWVGDVENRFQQGELLFETDVPEKRWELLKLLQDVDEVATRIRILEENQVNDASVAYELPTLRELQSELLAKQNVLQPELASLKQYAPSNGFFVHLASSVQQSLTRESSYQHREYPLQLQNLGTLLERGQQLGWFTSKNEIAIHALISETEMRWIEVGMQAEAVLDSDPSLRLPCTVQQLALEPISELPIELMGDPSLVAVRDENGVLRLETPHYLVVLQPTSPICDGLRGAGATLHFALPGKTLWQYAWQFGERSFHPYARIQ